MTEVRGEIKIRPVRITTEEKSEEYDENARTDSETAQLIDKISDSVVKTAVVRFVRWAPDAIRKLQGFKFLLDLVKERFGGELDEMSFIMKLGSWLHSWVCKDAILQAEVASIHNNWSTCVASQTV